MLAPGAGRSAARGVVRRPAVQNVEALLAALAEGEEDDEGDDAEDEDEEDEVVVHHAAAVVVGVVVVGGVVGVDVAGAGWGEGVACHVRVHDGGVGHGCGLCARLARAGVRAVAIGMSDSANARHAKLLGGCMWSGRGLWR